MRLRQGGICRPRRDVRDASGCTRRVGPGGRLQPPALSASLQLRGPDSYVRRTWSAPSSPHAAGRRRDPPRAHLDQRGHCSALRLRSTRPTPPAAVAVLASRSAPTNGLTTTTPSSCGGVIRLSTPMGPLQSTLAVSPRSSPSCTGAPTSEAGRDGPRGTSIRRGHRHGAWRGRRPTGARAGRYVGRFGRSRSATWCGVVEITAARPASPTCAPASHRQRVGPAV